MQLGRSSFILVVLLLGGRLAAGEELPDFDKRPSRSLPEEALQAKNELQRRSPKISVDWDTVTGAPKWIASQDGFLTEGESVVVTPAFRAKHPGTDPHRVTKAFLDEHQQLFGHDSTALNNARKSRDYVTQHNGVRSTVWQAEHAGVDIFEATFVSHTGKNGEIINLSSHWPRKLSQGVAKAGKDPQPRLTAQQAIVVAAEHLGQRTADDLQEIEPALGKSRKQKFRASFIRGQAHARLLWLPTDEGTLLLCWEVALKVRSRPEVYRLLLEARTGEVMVRRCQTTDISNASYRVFTGDSPMPLSPGYDSVGNTNHPATASRVLQTLSALNVTASPNGWINDGVNETRGNNVDASTDLDADDALDLPRPQGSPNRVFDFPLNLGQGPATYSKAAVVNLFYWCNWIHDKLYELGFNEASGNFQVNNFGKGGVGGDAVRAEAQDGEGTKNANFNWFNTDDGEDAWIQMYLWPDTTPDRDGDLDAQIIIHEYVHGLSTRLVGGGVGLSGTQPKGMGEGWSDFYALALLSESSDPLGGNYPVGGYVTRDYKYSQAAPPFLDNYYFGIRRYPYSTNLNKNPLTFQDIDPTQDEPHSGVPISGMTPNWPTTEVHSVGEVWCAILWEVRANLIAKLGFASGNQLTLQLVTDGMKLSPANPTFVQARDAILQAELAFSGGAHKTELWRAFAKRGIGAEALAPPSGTTVGVLESYTIPDTLRITPLTDIKIYGFYGGPFTMANQTYTLSNASLASLSWAGSVDSPLQLSLGSGTLASAGKQTVTVSLNSAAANLLPAGVNEKYARFSNQVTHVVSPRRFTFTVNEPLLLLPDYDLHELVRGPQGGPFKLLFDPLEVTNRANVSVSWSAYIPPPFSVPPSGSVPAHTAFSLPVGVSSAALLLPQGVYKDTLFVTNLTTGSVLTRDVTLEVLNDNYLTEGFSSDGDFDLKGMRITFIPDGSPAYYSVCREPTASFPTDPSGGTELHHSSYSFDESAEVALSGGKTVSIYGIKTNLVRVNFDGSVSFGAKDDYVSNTLMQHFRRIRLSGLLSDYSAVTSVDAGAVVSWKQLADRFAVTWQNVVPSFSFVDETNSFQVELFFNGQLRVTILEADDPFAVVGVSRGTNSPPDFIDTDFSALGSCANVLPKLIVTAPSPVKEGTNLPAGSGRVKIPSPRVDPLTVNLASSDTTEITVPPSVNIPAGATSAVFNVTVVNDALIDGSKGVTITASAQFYQSGTCSVQVDDNETNVLTVTLGPSVKEGGPNVTGTVTTKFPVGDAVFIGLSSVAPNELLVAGFPFAYMASGATSATFNVFAVDDRRIDGTQVAGITASVPNWGSGFDVIQVLDNESTNLQVLAPIFLSEGAGSLTNAGEVRLGGTVTSNLTVTLTSDAFFTLFPSSPIIIPAGQSNAPFTLNIWDNTTIDPTRMITLTGAAPGFSNAQWSVFLFDDDGPPEATEPSPAHLADNASLTTDLSWRPKEGQLILNGSFESLLANWTREDTGAGGWISALGSYDPLGPAEPHPAADGSRYALSQQYGSGRHILWQEVSIPNSVWPVQLTWSHRVQNHAPAFTSNHQFRVELRDTDNNTLATLFATQPGDPLLTEWTNVVADVAAYREKTVRVAFVEEDALGMLNVSLDGVSLVANPPAPTSWLVYFGTDPTPDASEFVGSTNTPSWSLPTLVTNTTYYWQVSSVRAGQTNPGPVWQFTTTESANRPPSIALGTPGTFTAYYMPANLLLSPRVLSDDGIVTKVEYYTDGAFLAQVGATPWSFTWTNPPPGEHTVHAVAQDNGGLRTTSSVSYVSIVPTNGALTLLSPFGSAWRYYDGGGNLGTSWRSSTYTDRTWSFGAGQFGYGEGDETTVLDYGNDPAQKHITSYFRRSFSTPSGAQSLWLRILRDDGLAVYINGNEVLRNNLSAGAGYLTPATADISGVGEAVRIHASASPTNLAGRTSVIAAEVHQSSASSVDLSFDLELSAVVNLQPHVTLTTPAPNSLFVAPVNIQLAASPFDPYGAVVQVQFFANNTSLGIDTTAPYSLPWNNAPTGNHLLYAVVTDNQGSTNTSAKVPVQIVGPEPPLTITYAPGQTILSWPSSSTGYHLETTTNLEPPILWSPIEDAPTLNNGYFQIIVPTNGLGKQFFRLTAP